MNTVVCIKAVPSTTKVRMDPVTNTLIRDGRQSVVNPFDQSALEEAVQIKERLGGTVTALSMGIPDTVRLLRDCLSRGADYGLLLSDRAFAGADTLATSYALSCAVRQLQEGAIDFSRPDEVLTPGCAPALPVDLVICGKMAVDGDTAQIGPEIASVLGIPCVTDVVEIIDVTPDLIRVRRGLEGGTAIVEVRLPAVITVVKDICSPRMPSITGVRFGEQGPVAVRTATQVGADTTRCGLAGSPTQVVRSFTPDRDEQCVVFEGPAASQAAQLVELLEGIAL